MIDTTLPRRAPGGIAYTVLGRRGPFLLAVHGGPGMDHAYFRPWLDHLAVDFLLNKPSPSGVVNPQPTVGISNVGVYSNASMWQKITGGWKPGLPVWYAGTSTTSCSSASSFTGGSLWLVQHASGTADGDVACP